MARQLATILLMTIIFIGIGTSSLEAQQDKYSNAILRGISAVSVVVDKVPDSVRAMGVTEQMIQTDVELKLRLAGMRIADDPEWVHLPGRPLVYVYIEAVPVPRAVHVEVGLAQDSRLERNGATIPGAKTWGATIMASGNLTSQNVRDLVKDELDLFLNAWLSVNPKK